ncbi:MAG: hypothetical protein ACI9U2_003166 [Bradymonadia bacterium]|jgi:hypothetical protein
MPAMQRIGEDDIRPTNETDIVLTQPTSYWRRGIAAARLTGRDRDLPDDLAR